MDKEPFDIARIVPSMRDLHAALMTQKKSLGLVPLIDGDASISDAAALDALDVRAFSMSTPGVSMQQVARSTTAMPMLLLEPCSSPTDCQRARYFGSDAVCIDASTEATWRQLAGSCRSMRMMPIALVSCVEQLSAALAWGARGVFLQATTDDVLRMAAGAKRVWLATRLQQADSAVLKDLKGQVDAVVVAYQATMASQLEEWLDAFDS